MRLRLFDDRDLGAAGGPGAADGAVDGIVNVSRMHQLYIPGAMPTVTSPTSSRCADPTVT